MSQPGDPFDPSRPAVAVNPYAAPASDFTAAPPALAPSATSRGPQIAGGLMLASAPATLISMSSGSGAAFAGSAIIDVLVGISLVRGNLKWRGLAVVRVVLGTLIFGGKALASSNVMEGAFTVAYAAPFLLLLLGTPGKPRTIVGGLLGGVLLALIYVALAVR